MALSVWLVSNLFSDDSCMCLKVIDFIYPCYSQPGGHLAQHVHIYQSSGRGCYQEWSGRSAHFCGTTVHKWVINFNFNSAICWINWDIDFFFVSQNILIFQMWWCDSIRLLTNKTYASQCWEIPFIKTYTFLNFDFENVIVHGTKL